MWRCNGSISSLSTSSASFWASKFGVASCKPLAKVHTPARTFSSAVTTLPRLTARRSFPRPLPTCWYSYRMASTLPRLPLFEAISKHDPESTAVTHCLSGRTFRYGELLPDVARARDRIYQAAGKTDVQGERIAFLVENSYDYIGKGCQLLPIYFWEC